MLSRIPTYIIAITVLLIAAGLWYFLESQQLQNLFIALCTLILAYLLLKQQQRSSKRQRKEKQYSNSYFEMARAVDQAPINAAIFDKNRRIAHINRSMCTLLGVDRDSAIGSELNAAPLNSELVDRIDACFLHGEDWMGDVATSDHQEAFPLLGTLTAIKDKSGNTAAVMLLCERHDSGTPVAEHISRLESEHPLSKLSNRQQSLKVLQSLMDASGKKPLALLAIDIDRFHFINDSLSADSGDELLRQFAERLRNFESGEGLRGHIGDNEFLFSCELPADGREAQALQSLIDALMQKLNQPYRLAEAEVSITCCIGAATSPRDASNANELLGAAQSALRLAKQRGANHSYVYKAETGSRNIKRIQTETQLRYAIDRGELSLYLQPVIDLKTQQLSSAEVLLRWHNAELGDPRPDHFITIAEDSGLIVPIGEWVLEQACKEAASWAKQGGEALRIAVNVSSRQFVEGEILQTVKRALSSSGLPPSKLVLEVTEGVLIGNKEKTQFALNSIRQLGVKLALDDFGTGYSSLSYLRDYPFDYLKIDRAFVNGMTENDDKRALALAIIAMAQSLGMSVIAEGVETIDQRRLLQSKGCDFAQGFLYSPPLPTTRFAHWAKEYQQLQAQKRSNKDSSDKA